MGLKYREIISRDNISENGAKLLHQCVGCEKLFPHKFINLCDECGSLVDVFYDYANADIYNSANSLTRYADLIPIVSSANHLWGGEGNTPCYRAKRLEKELGHNCIYIKDETRNPTCTTKDRMASIMLSYFKELGIDEIVINSTGNSSTAIARAVALHRSLKLNIFAGEYFLPRLNYQDDELIKTHALKDDFALTELKALSYARQNNLVYEASFFNPARREGLKLTYLEAFDQMQDAPEYIFQAVSSGMGLLGAYKGALEYIELGRLQKLPKIVPVQQASCDPMVKAYRDGAHAMSPSYAIHNPEGIAKAILLGNPAKSYSYIKHIVDDSGGDMYSVGESEIRAARSLLYDTESISVCYSASAALAGAKNAIAQGKVHPDDPILINLTGADRPKYPVPENFIPCDVQIPEEIMSMFRK